MSDPRILCGPELDAAEIPRGNVFTSLIKELEGHDASETFLQHWETKEELTFGQMVNKIKRLQSGLLNFGLKEQDVVLTFMRTQMEFMPLSFAVASVGGIFAPSVHTQDLAALTHQIKTVQPKIIIADDDLMQLVEEARANANSNTQIFATKGDQCNRLPLSSLYADKVDEHLNLTFPDEFEQKIALLQFTSGTTGRPKAAMITHRCIALRVYHFKKAIPASVAVLPFVHTVSFINLCRASVSGYRVNFVSSPPFDLDDILAVIEATKCPMVFLTYPIQVDMVKNLKVRSKYDISCLKLILTGATPLSADFEELFMKTFPHIACHGQMYGSTELSGVSICRYDDEKVLAGKKRGSSGTPIAGTKFKVLELNGQGLLPANERGEIYLHNGEMITSGYFRDEEHTRELLMPDGWARTGDYGYYDEEGYLFVLQRICDLIHTKNKKIVCPSEMEGYIIVMDKVKDVAVVGIDRKDGNGQVPIAFVVKQDDVELTAEEVIEQVARRVGTSGDEKLLYGGVRFIKELPRSTAGKNKNFLLKQWALEEDF